MTPRLSLIARFIGASRSGCTAPSRKSAIIDENEVAIASSFLLLVAILCPKRLARIPAPIIIANIDEPSGRRLANREDSIAQLINAEYTAGRILSENIELPTPAKKNGRSEERRVGKQSKSAL